MKDVNKNSLMKYCLNVSEDTPKSIKKNFVELEKAENKMFDMYETVREIAKCVYIYIDKHQIAKGDDKVPYFFEFYETMQTESEKYNPSSLFGYTLNIIAESGFVFCDLLNNKLVSLEESIFNPCQNIIKNYPVLNKFRYMISTNYENLDGVQAKIKSGCKMETKDKKNHPMMVLHNLGIKFEENQKEVLKTFHNFLQKEELTIRKISQMILIKHEYHKRNIAELDKTIETSKSRLSGVYRYPVFGVSLKEHLDKSKTEICIVIHDAVAWILKHGMDEEGIFRLGANKTKVDKLVAAYDADIFISQEFIPSVHVMCALLKQYLRSLPESLLFKSFDNNTLRDLFKQPSNKQNEILKTRIQELPKEYYNNLKYLFKFLEEVTFHQNRNKMSAQNLGVIFSPCLIAGIQLTDDEMISFSSGAAGAVQRIIHDFKIFFPEGCELKLDKYYRIKYQSENRTTVYQKDQQSDDENFKEISSDNEEDNSFNPPYYFTNPRAHQLFNLERSK